jgi:tRNA A-37 threonylcarbamoyl transferase component Bud32
MSIISQKEISTQSLPNTLHSITGRRFSNDTLNQIFWEVVSAERKDEPYIKRIKVNGNKHTLLMLENGEAHLLLTHQKQGDRCIGSPGGYKVAKLAVNLMDPREINVVAIEKQLANMKEGEIHQACADIPGVVTLKTWVSDAGKNYYMMEYCKNGTLGKVLASEPSLSLATQTVRWGYDIAKTLLAIHARGYVHGDVHPGNLFLNADNVIKVADFGTAFAYESKSHTQQDITEFSNTLAVLAGYQEHVIASTKGISFLTNLNAIAYLKKSQRIFQQFVEKPQSLGELVSNMEKILLL